MSVTLALVIITVIPSLYNFQKGSPLLDKWALYPYDIQRKGEYYRIFTHGFIHADVFHLLFNMFTLFSFGSMLERNFLNTYEMLGIYFFSLVGSSLFDVITNKDNPSYRSIGASGAVCGLIFSGILFVPFNLIYVFFIPMWAWLFGILYTAYSIYSAKNSQDNIAHYAHLFGALSGIIATTLLHPEVWRNILAML